MMMRRLSGLVSAAYTPMDRDGAIRLGMVGELVEYALAHQNAALFVNGSTGEFPSLTLSERKELALEYVRCAAGRLPIIVNIGSCCASDSCELGKHAAAIGADAVCVMAPFYFRPETVRDLAEFVKGIVPCCGGLPVFIYHAPGITGVRLPMPEFLSIMRDEVPTFAGMKFTNENLCEFMECVRVSERMQMLSGRDEMLLGALAMGAQAAVGTTFNYIPRIYQSVMSCFASGDLAGAQRWMSRAHEVVRVCRPYGLAGIKVIMRFAGLDVGPMRRPVNQLSEEQIVQLGHELESHGLMEYVG